MASITGFGQSGPKKNLACNDLVGLAQSGFLYISGDPSLPPCKPPETQAYYFASLFAAAGVLFGPGSVEPSNPKAVRATMASLLHVPVVTTDAHGAARIERIDTDRLEAKFAERL